MQSWAGLGCSCPQERYSGCAVCLVPKCPFLSMLSVLQQLMQLGDVGAYGKPSQESWHLSDTLQRQKRWGLCAGGVE